MHIQGLYTCLQYPVYTSIINLFAVQGIYKHFILVCYKLPLLTNIDRESDAKCTFLRRKLKDVNSVQFYAFSSHHQWVVILLIKITQRNTMAHLSHCMISVAMQFTNLTGAKTPISMNM